MSGLEKKLYVVTEKDVDCVRKYYGKCEEEIKNDCVLIQQWMAQQSHLPDDYDPVRIERFLLRNKFRLERTKYKLENYYTVRGANQELLKKLDPEGPVMQKGLKSMSFVPLPKLYNNTERIYVQRFIGDADDYSWEANTLIVLAKIEMELRHEYAIGIRCIIDLEGFNLTHMKTMGVNEISKAFYIFKECLSARVISIEYINLPSVFSILLEILKLAFPESLYKKINIHKDLESLKRIYPAEYLPSDYGGNLRSTDEIYEDVKKLLMENGEYLISRADVVSDESKRIGAVKNDMFGADGTFKSLNLD